MEIEPPNLLVNLFTWRPRHDVLPGENFLTEAFVHVLRINSEFRSHWLKNFLGQTVDERSVMISTRTSHTEVESGNAIYPDVDIRGDLESGASFHLLIEVKWGAAYSPSQLISYGRLLQGKKNPHLVFLCARNIDYRRAISDATRFEHAKLHPVLWESVYEVLERTKTNCPFSKELLGFMSHHGLSPAQPMSKEMAEAYIASKPIFSRFQRYAEKLLHEYPWTILPASYQDSASANVRDRYGRVALEFVPSWNGAITVGFLYDNRDHAVPFADGTGNSIDLMMRIEAAPKALNRDIVNTAIAVKAEAVRRTGGVVRTAGDGVNGNRHTLFIVQKSLTDFLDRPSEGEQLQVMYEQIERWANALFSDGLVGDALNQLR